MSGPSPKLVIVALSGGVDSAVAALLLKQQGHRVEALHMTNWDAADEYCTAGDDLRDATRVCRDLDLPLHHVNFTAEYRARVFADFLSELRAGRTPNPDVACNRHIKFGAFLDHALRLGADCIATGHYARVDHGPPPRLLLAADAHKDQTYFLHAIEPQALSRTLFPLGNLAKAEVRALARRHGLANHARPDSTGICFIGERPFREFLAQYVPHSPGPILDDAGEVLGEHEGLPFYTLGQRQGLKVGGRARHAAAPFYVAAKDQARNALIVVQDGNHPCLHQDTLVAGDLRWFNGPPPGMGEGIALRARIRHGQVPAACRVWSTDVGGVLVRFDVPQKTPTPGQYVVFYRDDECLGGGTIEAAGSDTGSTASECRRSA